MDPHDRSALHDFVRRSHVHYEVEPEEVKEGRTELVGLRVRLLATHDREKLAEPGCPACVDLLGDLRALARRVAEDAGLGDRVETIPATHKLYQSSDASHADEVALTLRVRCDAPEHRTGEDACLAGLRKLLAELGVARQ